MKHKESIILVLLFVIMLGLLILGDGTTNTSFKTSFEDPVIVTNQTTELYLGTLTITNTGVLPIQPDLPSYVACSGNSLENRINFRRDVNDYTTNTYLSRGETKTFKMYAYYLNYRVSKDQFEDINEIVIYEEDTWSCYDLQTEPITNIKIENE